MKRSTAREIEAKSASDQAGVSLPGGTRDAGRDNNFNFLRLLFAILVILAHSPELVDGNRHREILTRIFGTLSFGEFAVNGFFLLSGYLITKSWIKSDGFFSYLSKRVLRIYPGFLAAALFCAAVVGPLGSQDALNYFKSFNLPQFLGRAAFLLPLPNPPAFEGSHHPVLNGSLWTISHEFRCYLLLAVVGLLGLFKRPRVVLILTLGILVVSLFPVQLERMTFRGSWYFFGAFPEFFHLLAFFLAGSCFYLFREKIRYTRTGMLVAGAVLIGCMFQMRTAQFGLALLGGYCLFALAFSQFAFLKKFQKIPDISYGVYLYGWPCQKLLVWYFPQISPWTLFFAATASSFVLGWISWKCVEAPFLKLKPKSA